MIDKDFMQQVREAKQSHERYMTAILACDVFPQLERVDPLLSKDEEEIPARFGPKWFEEERKDEEQKDSVEKEGEFDQLLAKDDSHID